MVLGLIVAGIVLGSVVAIFLMELFAPRRNDDYEPAPEIAEEID